MVARTEEKLAEADSLLVRAAEKDKRAIYPAIHRDIAYAMASQSEDYAPAAGHLRSYVVGHIGVDGSLPSDLDDVYDKMVLFGDNEWVPPTMRRLRWNITGASPHLSLEETMGAILGSSRRYWGLLLHGVKR